MPWKKWWVQRLPGVAWAFLGQADFVQKDGGCMGGREQRIGPVSLFACCVYLFIYIDFVYILPFPLWGSNATSTILPPVLSSQQSFEVGQAESL